jgi:hypothetical protein
MGAVNVFNSSLCVVWKGRRVLRGKPVCLKAVCVTDLHAESVHYLALAISGKYDIHIILVSLATMLTKSSVSTHCIAMQALFAATFATANSAERL